MRDIRGVDRDGVELERGTERSVVVVAWQRNEIVSQLIVGRSDLVPENMYFSSPESNFPLCDG